MVVFRATCCSLAVSPTQQQVATHYKPDRKARVLVPISRPSAVLLAKEMNVVSSTNSCNGTTIHICVHPVIKLVNA